MTSPEERDPQTRRAHPTLVRVALAEAEVRARDKLDRSALVARVAAQTRPRFTSTAPRLRTVTPLPPPPTGDAAPATAAIDAGTPPLPPVQDAPPSPAADPPAAHPHEAPPEPSASSVGAQTSSIASALERDPEDRRALVFWLALVIGAASLLALAALN